MDNLQKFIDAVENNNMSAEDVTNLFLNFHGTQLLTNDFIEYVEDEGYEI